MGEGVKDNPFTILQDALLEMMTETERFRDLVSIGNLIGFNKDNRDPLKRTPATSDLPEIVLAPAGMTMNLFSSSSGTTIFRRFDWLMSTGDFRVNNVLHQVEWQLVVGLLNWKNKLAALTWKDKTFVKIVQVLDITEGLADPERNRSIQGWSSVWACEARLDFTTTDIQSLAIS